MTSLPSIPGYDLSPTLRSDARSEKLPHAQTRRVTAEKDGTLLYSSLRRPTKLRYCDCFLTAWIWPAIERDNIFAGRILGIPGIPGIPGIRSDISFHGETVAELRAAVERAIKDYPGPAFVAAQAPH